LKSKSTLCLAAALAIAWSASTRAAESDSAQQMEDDRSLIVSAEHVVALPEPINDPLEPMNRGLWEVNKGLMIGVVQPSSKVYRAVVCPVLRTGIRNAGRNILYPKRVVNNLLQTRWTGARDESYRFLCNTFLGVGGLFDPATTAYEIPESEADFGQTMGSWGWRPKVYLMLPIMGPSNERDALGAVVDGLLNPLSYFEPYSYITTGVTYNNLTETVDTYVRSVKSDYDPYAVLRYAWTLKRESRLASLELEGEQDPASLETLQSVLFVSNNQDFAEKRKTWEVVAPGTGKKVPYTAWMQKTNAPLVMIAPGLGSHRLSSGSIALAELLYQNGFSVAVVSSAYNFEFMELASTAAMPGYTPVDAADLEQVLAVVKKDLQKRRPGLIGKTALMGYSMGGFHALYLAGNKASHASDGNNFDRYVAIDAPIRLSYAISKLDDFFRAALDWPAEERTAKIEQTFVKVAALSKSFKEITPDTVIPLNANESKFLIGIAFRLHLRDIIYQSQLRTNMHLLRQPLSKWTREPVYHEILQYSFANYLEKFVKPYYQTRGVNLNDAATFRQAVNLTAYTPALKQNSDIRILENANDILLADRDLDWLRKTFSDQQLTVFPHGGHLGNLSNPAVQQAIIATLDGLKAQPVKKQESHAEDHAAIQNSRFYKPQSF
jgi:ABC-type transporter lipoprotein component MlaA/pimeloyl-ACP methyl ester carboxylesterase